MYIKTKIEFWYSVYIPKLSTMSTSKTTGATKITKSNPKVAVSDANKKAPKTAKTAKKVSEDAKPAADPVKQTAKEIRDKKTSDEKIRIDRAYNECIEANFIGDYAEINNKSFQSKISETFVSYVLSNITDIQSNEVKNENSFNPYKPETHILQRVKPEKKTKKAAEPVDNGSDDLQQDDHDDEDDISEKKVSKPKKAADKPKKDSTKKKNIIQMSKNTKTYIFFIINRFVMEVKSVVDKIRVDKKNRDAFTKEKFISIIFADDNVNFAKTVIATVNRLESSLSYDDSVSATAMLINTTISTCFTNPQFRGFVADYIISYLKLIASVSSMYLWVYKKNIQYSIVELAMRTLDIGNTAYVAEKKYSESDYIGLTGGVLEDIKHVNSIMNPLPPKKASKPKAARSSLNDSESKSTNTKVKALPKSEKSEDVDPEDVEAESDAEDVEMDAAEEGDEQDGEADGDETEETEVEAEDPETEEDVPKIKLSGKKVHYDHQSDDGCDSDN